MEFREFLEDLKGSGDIREVTEPVNWDLQASAICSMSQRVGGPAVAFTNVKDYPGMQLVGSLFSGKGFIDWPQQKRRMHGRIAQALGLGNDIHYSEFMETLIDRKKSPIRPILVEKGPCQEVVIEGKDIDLFKYPIPRIHDKDGGRYLTSHVVLTRDETKKWTNFGVYRLMLLAKDRLVQGTGPRVVKPRHVDEMISEAEKKVEPVPFAVVIGGPPEMMMAACLHSPSGTDEYSIAGGLGLNSIPLVKAKLSDILVPAGAEMVLEGHIYPNETAEEGPFGGISFYTDPKENSVYRVECITQRKDPILPFVAEGTGASDSVCLFSVMHSLEIMEHLRMCGILAKWVSLPVEAKLVLAVVSLSAQPLPGLPGRLGKLVLGMSPMVRQVLVIDPDLDAEDFALQYTDRTFKANIERDYHISKINKPLGWTENHDFSGDLTSTLIIDATWRSDRPRETVPRRVTFEACFPEAVQKSVVENWEKYDINPKAFRFTDHE